MNLISFAPTTIDFTTTNWNAPQTLTLRAVPDPFLEPARDPVALTADVTTDDSALQEQVNTYESALEQAAQDSSNDYPVPLFSVQGPPEGVARFRFDVVEILDPGPRFLLKTDRSGYISPKHPLVLWVRMRKEPRYTVTMRGGPDYISFTRRNWRVPQPILLAGQDDGQRHASHVWVSVPGMSRGGWYHDQYDTAAQHQTLTWDDADGTVWMSDANMHRYLRDPDRIRIGVRSDVRKRVLAPNLDWRGTSVFCTAHHQYYPDTLPPGFLWSWAEFYDPNFAPTGTHNGQPVYQFRTDVYIRGRAGPWHHLGTSPLIKYHSRRGYVWAYYFRAGKIGPGTYEAKLVVTGRRGYGRASTVFYVKPPTGPPKF
jgi:hypothetical protein